MGNLTNRFSISDSFQVYERRLLIDLLIRGQLTKEDRLTLTNALELDNLSLAQSVLEQYELKPRGIDTKSLLSNILNAFNMKLEGTNSINGYTVTSEYSNDLLKYPHILGSYRYLQDIGDTLRNLEGKPGTLNRMMLELYSWGKCLNNKRPNKSKTEVKQIEHSDLTRIKSLVSNNKSGKVIVFT